MKNSTSRCTCFENVPAPAKHWRERFVELKRSFQDFHALLERLFESSSEGSQGVPVSPSQESDSQAS